MSHSRLLPTIRCKHLVAAAVFALLGPGWSTAQLPGADTRARPKPAITLLLNGDFERGLQGWQTNHTWYPKPKGAGLSEVVVVDAGRTGGRVLKIIGGGKRGLALRSRPIYPGPHRVAGWIKCEQLEAGQAGVLVEWFDGQAKYLRGDWAAKVSGTQDWRQFETVIEAPPGARSVHFDLITTEPNHGTAWFDDLEFARLPSAAPPPTAPTISAITPKDRDGCLELTWDPQKLSDKTVRLLVYCEPGALQKLDDRTPRTVFEADAGRGVVWSLENGTTYLVAAVAVDADGKRSALGPVVRSVVTDRQPPRPGWIGVQRIAAESVQVAWSPHVLDSDVKRIQVGVPGAREGEWRELASLDVARLYDEPGPLYSTAPWASLTVRVPSNAIKVGVVCEDKAGNRGEVGWAAVPSAPRATGPAPCDWWIVPPTEQVRRDAPRPPQAGAAPELVLMRGQAKGFQIVVRPEQELRATRVSFEPLVHEDGRTRLDPRWLAYHFVNYVRIEKNSRATPKDELVWPAPAEYPDELSDDLARDLPAGQAQPIYVRVTAPRNAQPGLYRGHGWIECNGGRKRFDLAIRISPVPLAGQTQLKFVYWFSWDAPCKQFGVEPFSADGWRVLARLGELMRVHHQNTVVVPLSLVRTWQTSTGALAHDFADFDRFVRTFLAQGVDRMFCLSHVGSRTTGEWECPTMSSHTRKVRRLDTGDPEEVDALELLPALERHLDQMGWLDRFAVHVADEPTSKNVESYRQLAARVKQAAPRLRRVDAVHVPDLSGALEVWVPQLNYFEQSLDQFRAAQRSGSELWFYIAWVPQGRYPNRMIDSQAIKSRVLHWLNAIYDTTGYLHWALNHWSIPLTSLESPGDQYICWPSRRFIANSSLRYEAEREGLEDCELMFMLRAALQKHGLTRDDAQRRVEEIARKAVRKPQDFTRSWPELENVRLELLSQTAEALK